MARGDCREAIHRWIAAGVLELESKSMLDKMPFLDLAYACQVLGLADAERWLLAMADRASPGRPVRLDAAGTELRHRLARSAMEAGDDGPRRAIAAFHDKWKTGVPR